MIKKTILLVLLVHSLSLAQSIDSTQTARSFSGIITATNNGISLIPNFSLNKPAILFDLSVGRGRLSFDPMFRFGMDGKPWTFVFWWRYKLFARERFKMSLGAHPAFLFRTLPLVTNGVSSDYLTAQRYLAWETTPTYFINKKIGVGMYYLGSHGIGGNATRFTNFLAIRGIFSKMALSKEISLDFVPQIYYLKLDKSDGTYVNASVTLRKNNFPLTVSSIVSKALETELPGRDFIWNVGLNYTFENTYHKVRKP